MPCTTSHSRQFPKKHGFAYSYLQVAFQVGSTGVHGGRFLGIETNTSSGDPWTWFTISADDYLFRGPSADGTLLGKLHAFLKTENVDPSETPYVFLATAPRFLGYSFNPVSFWYLYDQQKTLKYMILEVNNTFGERRMYLLDGSASANQEEVVEKLSKETPFRQTWIKDFHVSPFSSRKGSYSLMASNPHFMDKDAAEKNGPQIDNTITLRSSKSHPKLVARLFSNGPAFTANSATTLQKIRFILSWCLVGFLTFPRILKQAASLFFSHGLHVWFRPEVLRSSLGRHPTWRETVIGNHFARFLQRRCRRTGIPNKYFVPVQYTHALAVPGPRTWYLGVADAPATTVEASRAKAALHVQVLTPMFYTQYAVDKDHVRRQFKHMPSEEHTVSVLGADDSQLADDRYLTTTDASEATYLLNRTLTGYQEDDPIRDVPIVPWRWRLLSILRRYGRNNRSPAVYERADGQGPRRKPESKYDVILYEDHGLYLQRGVFGHPLDDAVFKGLYSDNDDTRYFAEQYRKAVAGLLFAGILTFGSVELLDAAVWIFDKVVLLSALGLMNESIFSGEWSVVSALAILKIVSGLFFR